MNVTKITRSIPRKNADSAFSDIVPDLTKGVPVRWQKNQHLLSSDPLKAGLQFHNTLPLLFDFAHEPTPTQRAYLGWLSALRRAISSLDADSVITEVKLAAYKSTPNGTCDLVVCKDDSPVGIIETKVFVNGAHTAPRGRDLVQLAAYVRLQARNHSYDQLWAALAYVEIETQLVRFFLFRNPRNLVTRTIELLQAA